MPGRTRFGDFDWILFGFALLISVLGIIEIYSVTVQTELEGHHLLQLLWVGLGLVGMFVLSRLDYHAILDYMPWIYVGSIGILIALLVVGNPVGGTRRWMHLGGLNFQVSEIVKVIIIAMLARSLGSMEDRYLSWKGLLKIGFLVALPLVLVALQPDLGTALTFAVIALAGVWLAGIRGRQVLALVVVGALLVPVGYSFLKPYQKERLKTFLQPGEDVRDSGYQINQSKIAIGSGGFWGKGLRRGTQNRLGFIPGVHTDFIFAAFAEEHGFAGTVFVLVLYLSLIMRLVHSAQSAGDRTGSFLVMGFVAVVFFQIALSTAMIIGLAPVTGIPLPLMTYGGSSVLSTFLGLGLATSVRMRRFVN